MAPAKVVDASAVAALLFGEPDGPLVASRLGDGQLTAPVLLGFELGNVYLVKARRHPEQRAALAAAFSLRHRLAIGEAAVDHDAVVEPAGATGLTAYDASYLWLARELGAELVTLDRKLAAAAGRIRIRVAR